MKFVTVMGKDIGKIAGHTLLHCLSCNETYYHTMEPPICCNHCASDKWEIAARLDYELRFWIPWINIRRYVVKEGTYFVFRRIYWRTTYWTPFIKIIPRPLSYFKSRPW